MSKKSVGIGVGLFLALAGVSVFLISAPEIATADKRCQEKYHGGHAVDCCDKAGSDSYKKKHCFLYKRKECVVFYLKKSEELGLTEEQIAKLKKLKRDAEILRIRNLAEAKVLKVEIGALMDEKRPDLSEIDARIDKISKLKADVKKNCVRAALGAREVLTEEQLQKAQQIRKKCELPPEHKHRRRHSCEKK